MGLSMFRQTIQNQDTREFYNYDVFDKNTRFMNNKNCEL